MVSLQGLAAGKRSTPATTRGVVSVGADASRTVALRVKPKYLQRYRTAEKVAVTTTVRVGQVRVTVVEQVAVAD